MKTYTTGFTASALFLKFIVQEYNPDKTKLSSCGLKIPVRVNEIMGVL